MISEQGLALARPAPGHSCQTDQQDFSLHRANSCPLRILRIVISGKLLSSQLGSLPPLMEGRQRQDTAIIQRSSGMNPFLIKETNIARWGPLRDSLEMLTYSFNLRLTRRELAPAPAGGQPDLLLPRYRPPALAWLAVDLLSAAPAHTAFAIDSYRISPNKSREHGQAKTKRCQILFRQDPAQINPWLPAECTARGGHVALRGPVAENNPDTDPGPAAGFTSYWTSEPNDGSGVSCLLSPGGPHTLLHSCPVQMVKYLSNVNTSARPIHG
ncbi:unnamed protein product [Pleuronectes platessa]|uniref:Uncharacterized protein n=1 Tax=Pleuronectes platessa TaxID=8262 RepID=A0A9N7Y7Y4_PLEPL|nr:unnamed protein product [Pleuronectes platessa]